MLNQETYETPGGGHTRLNSNEGTPHGSIEIIKQCRT